MTFRAIIILMFEALMVSINVSETAAVSGGRTGTPPNYMDCSTLSLNMADCQSFLTSGSTTETEGTCCSGLKLELKEDTECLCEGFRNAAQLGLTLNITRAVGLPAACHVSDPAVSDCGLNSILLSRGPVNSILLSRGPVNSILLSRGPGDVENRFLYMFKCGLLTSSDHTTHKEIQGTTKPNYGNMPNK